MKDIEKPALAPTTFPTSRLTINHKRKEMSIGGCGKLMARLWDASRISRRPRTSWWLRPDKKKIPFGEEIRRSQRPKAWIKITNYQKMNRQAEGKTQNQAEDITVDSKSNSSPLYKEVLLPRAVMKGKKSISGWTTPKANHDIEVQPPGTARDIKHKKHKLHRGLAIDYFSFSLNYSPRDPN